MRQRGLKFEQTLAQMKSQFDTLCSDFKCRSDEMHTENKRRADAMHADNIERLRNIDHTARNNSETLGLIGSQVTGMEVKLDALYGPTGAVEKLGRKIDAVANLVTRGVGAITGIMAVSGIILTLLKWH